MSSHLCLCPAKETQFILGTSRDACAMSTLPRLIGAGVGDMLDRDSLSLVLKVEEEGINFTS